MRFISLPFRNILRRLTRSVLTILGISVAIAGFICFIGVSRGIENAWEKNLLNKGTHILAVKKGAVELLTSTIDYKIKADLEKTDGIQSVSGELVDFTTLGSGQAVIIQGWDPLSFMWKSLHIVNGRLPEKEDRNVVLLGKTISSVLSKTVGDTVTIYDTSYEVIGLFLQNNVMSNGAMIMPLPDLQHLMGKENKVTGFNIRVINAENDDFVTTVVNSLNTKFSGLYFSKTSEIADNNQLLKMLSATSWIISIIALGMALIVVLNTLLMAVMERTREIGILTALGWSSKRIILMIITEGMILTGIGAITGSFLGFWCLEWIKVLPKLQGIIEPAFSFNVVLEIFYAAFLLGILGSIYPAYRAVKLHPIDALRYE